jgi:hypothetical protein
LSLSPCRVVVLNRWVTDTKEAPWASSTYDLGEIGSEPLPGLDIGEEPLQRRPLHGAAGETAVIVVPTANSFLLA